MATTVTILVVDDSLGNPPVDGVLVRANLPDRTLVTEGATDVGGSVTFLLPAGSYDLITYKSGFSSTQYRLVVGDGDPEVWEIVGHTFSPPESADLNLCRVWGYFIGLDGHPAKDAKLIFSPQAELVTLNDAVLTPGSYLQVYPDDRGYVELDLIRGVTYDVYLFNVPMLNNQAPPKIAAQVPDLPSANLGRMMFPVPVAVTFSKATLDLPLASEADKSVLTTISYSDGTAKGINPGWANVFAAISDPLVAEVSTIEGCLVIKPLSVGVANVTMTRAVGKNIIYLPSIPGFSSDTVTVTVS